MEPRSDVRFSDVTNYRIGGKIRHFCEATTVEDIKEALALSKREKAPFFVLGGGTNLLPSDSEYNGVVIRPSFKSMELTEAGLRAGAGVLMSDLLDFTIEHGLSGLEWAGGLPGTLGGAVRGNAGAFKGEIKDSVIGVTSLNVNTGEVTKLFNPECNFTYRSSVFKIEGDEIILYVEILLTKGEKDAVAKSIRDKIEFRKSRHPLEFPNAGSVFKNVDVKKAPATLLNMPGLVVKDDPFPVIPAAYLISQAGLKGLREGQAMISEKHANFIVNLGGATSEDVRKLIRKVKDGIAARFGVELEEEIMLL